MRTIIAVCVLLSGCAAFTPVSSSDSGQANAVLSISHRADYAGLPGYDGIWSVDGRRFPSGPVQLIHVAPGHHAIEYNCPGWIFTDGPPVLRHAFEAGKRYEINCNGTPRIERLGDGA